MHSELALLIFDASSITLGLMHGCEPRFLSTNLNYVSYVTVAYNNMQPIKQVLCVNRWNE